MVRVILVAREPGGLKPDYSLKFDLPEVPRVGSYISVQRPDTPAPLSEDFIVRQVWWTLHHPETRTMVFSDDDEPEKVGNAAAIILECEPALGPYASDAWRKIMEGAKSAGVTVEEFDLVRFSVPENLIEE